MIVGRSGSIPLRCNTRSMLATSKIERRVMFRKFAKSISDALPEPSAMLFETLSMAALSCSLNRYFLRSSKASATSNTGMEISTARCQISISSKRNRSEFMRCGKEQEDARDETRDARDESLCGLKIRSSAFSFSRLPARVSRARVSSLSKLKINKPPWRAGIG